MGLPTIPPGVRPLRISELNEAANAVLDDLGSIWVAGEISGWKPHASGHYYFNLAEGSEARVDAVVWRSTAARLPAGVTFSNGMAVIACGRLNIYKNAGRYQFLVDRMFPQGLGASEEALRRLKEKLLAKGYFALERKRPLPTFPTRIALITSPTGAAIRDMLEVFVRRWPLAEIVLVGVRVQGETAATEIAGALGQLNNLHATRRLPLDAIIVGRGGGSADDLSAFNVETVADAIFRSQVPVVSAVGHEIDTTIADLVADCRALTPTHAASCCVPDIEETRQLVEERTGRLALALQRLAARGRERLMALAGRRAFRVPLERIHTAAQLLDERRERLAAATTRRIDAKRQQLLASAGKLEALSPLNVLTRGYSLTRTEDSSLVRDTSSLRIGDTITTILARGQVRSVVTALEAPPNG